MKAIYTRINRVMRRLPFGLKAEHRILGEGLTHAGEYVFMQVKPGHDVTVHGDADYGWMITINEVA